MTGFEVLFDFLERYGDLLDELLIDEAHSPA